MRDFREGGRRYLYEWVAYEIGHDLDFSLKTLLVLDFLLRDLFDGSRDFGAFLLAFEDHSVCALTEHLMKVS